MAHLAVHAWYAVRSCTSSVRVLSVGSGGLVVAVLGVRVLKLHLTF